MGTFHQDRGELHGITVVVETKGARVYAGRCDVADDRSIVLLDADFHEDGQRGQSKQDWIRHVARVGVWARYPRLTVPMPEVASVRRLGEIE